MDETSFAGVVSSASFDNQTIAWVRPNDIRAQSYFVAFDHQQKKLWEVKDPRTQFSVFSTVIPGEKGFFIIDNLTGKVAQYNSDFELINVSLILRWEGSEKTDSMKLTQINPSAPGVGIASYLDQNGEKLHYFLIDLLHQNIQKLGQIDHLKDPKTHIMGAQGHHYLIEPGLGNISVFDINQGKKGLALFTEGNKPLVAKYTSSNGFRPKLVALVSMYDTIYIHVNTFFDPSGDELKQPVRNHMLVTGTKQKESTQYVVGMNQDKTEYLTFNLEDQILERRQSL